MAVVCLKYLLLKVWLIKVIRGVAVFEFIGSITCVVCCLLLNVEWQQSIFYHVSMTNFVITGYPD